MKKTVLLFVFFTLLGVPGARALELSLEENKAESGTIGYVDISQVFKRFSGTSYARDEFLAEIKKKEDALNLKKQAIFSQKADIAALKQEREFALNLPALMRLERDIAAPAKAAGDTVPLTPDATAQTPLTGQTGDTVPLTPDTTAQAPLMGLAGDTDDEAVVATTAALSIPAGLPGVSRVPVNYFKFSVSTSVAEIDSALVLKQAELEKRQEDLRQARARTERELLEYEAHKSEMILGRIYMALKELAVEQGVSVVVDKKNILFGHSAVDLTDALVGRLEEKPL